MVNNVSYNAAIQLLTFNTETRTYDNLNQMTPLTITGSAPWISATTSRRGK